MKPCTRRYEKLGSLSRSTFLVLSVVSWILSIFDTTTTELLIVVVWRESLGTRLSKDVAASKSAFLLGLLHDTLMIRHIRHLFYSRRHSQALTYADGTTVL